MIEPLQPSGIALPNIDRDYVAMSVSPLEYKPYISSHGNITIGYAGVGIQDGELVTVAKLGDYDTSMSFDLMYDWLKPAADVCLPEAKNVTPADLDSVLGVISTNEPLALLQLETTERGERIISLAALTKLGSIAAATGIVSPEKPVGIQSFMGKKKLDEKAVFGDDNYRAIVVGGSLILRLFDSDLQAIPSGQNKVIERGASK